MTLNIMAVGTFVLNNNDIVQKLWSLSSVLRDDGMVYHQYMNELTYLLFLKIAEETHTESAFPDGYRWSDLNNKDLDSVLGFYRKMLTHLGEDAPNDQVRKIFAFPTTVFKHPQNLKFVISKINEIEWYSARTEGFGDIYEGLLEKNAVESKAGAGQYFTPRALIDSIVDIMRPAAGEIVQDPASGTGGFLVSADRSARARFGFRPKCEGIEIVEDTYRLCLMNLIVHGIDGNLIHGDALSEDYTALSPADLIVTNPPFGTRGGGGSPRRTDLAHPTTNKQLMFLQHIYNGLKDGGRAAVVLPDNVLFDAGVGQRIRTDLMRMCDLHTILRLPTGIFYAGVKTNVIFFTRNDRSSNNSQSIWVYDARTNVAPFGKRSPLTREFFRDFERCYGVDPHGKKRAATTAGIEDRWRNFRREEFVANGDNLDVRWLREDAGPEDGLARAEALTLDLIENFNSALRDVRKLSDLLSLSQNSSDG